MNELYTPYLSVCQMGVGPPFLVLSLGEHMVAVALCLWQNGAEARQLRSVFDPAERGARRPLRLVRREDKAGRACLRDQPGPTKSRAGWRAEGGLARASTAKWKQPLSMCPGAHS